MYVRDDYVSSSGQHWHPIHLILPDTNALIVSKTKTDSSFGCNIYTTAAVAHHVLPTCQSYLLPNTGWELQWTQIGWVAPAYPFERGGDSVTSTAQHNTTPSQLGDSRWSAWSDLFIIFTSKHALTNTHTDAHNQSTLSIRLTFWSGPNLFHLVHEEHTVRTMCMCVCAPFAVVEINQMIRLKCFAWWKDQVRY